jgi:hypothetical protein
MTVQLKSPELLGDCSSLRVCTDDGRGAKSDIGVNGVRLTNCLAYGFFWLVSCIWGRMECFVTKGNTREYVWLRGQEQELTKEKPYGLFREHFTNALTTVDPWAPRS